MGYNHKSHSSLEKNETPASRFAGNGKAIRFSNSTELREVFLWEGDRKVDATGCNMEADYTMLGQIWQEKR